jgi:hypothetical protein
VTGEVERKCKKPGVASRSVRQEGPQEPRIFTCQPTSTLSAET